MFSIIVPSYNRNAEVASLLENLTQQTKYNFEVVIVDDCSPEPIVYNAFLPFPIKILRNSTNLGAAGSRNEGAKNAQNDWLLFLDDDDRFLAEKCEKLESVIRNHPQINFIYHPAECVMVNEEFSYFTKPFNQIEQISLESILLANKIGGMPMIAVKKSLFFAVDGLSTELLALEDYEFLLKLIQYPDFKPFYVDDALTKCRFETKKMSVSKNIQHTEQGILAIQENYIKTPEQARNFRINSLYMLSYPYMMNYSRKAACYYFKMFGLTKNPKHLTVAFISALSPKLAILLRKYI